MRYIIEDNELLLLADGRQKSYVSVMEIWSCEERLANGALNLPSLSDLGLKLDDSYASVFVKLEQSVTGDFGVLNLYCKDYTGRCSRLRSCHKSDHAVVGDSLVPIEVSEIEHIKASLGVYSLELGRDLKFVEYLECLKHASDFAWFVPDWRFKPAGMTELGLSDTARRTPAMFDAQLAEYQVRGSNWLSKMVEQGVGVILGDGMGLGKTVQMIKTICDKLESNPLSHVLVICPSALVENWRREIEKFTIGVDVQCHFGRDRSGDFRTLCAPIVITTYDVAKADFVVLSQNEWDIIVLDEAQYIKNPESQRAKTIKRLPRRVGIAMTGTPFENHMMDVWSLVDFCCPGFLGDKVSFAARFQDDDCSADELGDLLAPLLLRRTLEDVPNDLPDLVQNPLPIALLPDEAYEYERRRIEYKQKGATLGSINRLIGDLAAPIGEGNGISNLKFEYLASVAEGVFGEKEKMIVFASRNASIDYLAEHYGRIVPTFALTGKTEASDRMQVVDSFSSELGPAMLVCNPRVGGAGLNITAANHVFHFSPQWNPAIIDQADARAHRRGQGKPVVAYYPYYASTVEEYMWDKVLMKRDLSEQVVVGNKGDVSANEILEALNMSPIVLS